MKESGKLKKTGFSVSTDLSAELKKKKIITSARVQAENFEIRS